jgi:putative transposase
LLHVRTDSRPSNAGRPVPGYSFNRQGQKVSDEQIKEYLCELITGDGFPYGYTKLTVALVADYGVMINRKKVYRLCKELQILQPQRVIKNKHPRRLARNQQISGSNQLWEMDIKYGYIAGQDCFFFQLSLIDVFDRSIIAYHLGLSCTAFDACLVIQNALRKRNITLGMVMPRIRTDNGPQFIALEFEVLCEKLGITHERIPVRTPNMNAHIESFHAILESECYRRNEFSNFIEAYAVITEYMQYYNERRRHGSLKFMSPKSFCVAFLSNSIQVQPFSA